MNTAAPFDKTASTRSYSIISSTGATTKSTNVNNNNNFKQLMGQLVRRILVTSRVSPNEWPLKESLLMSMSESILSR